MQHITTAYYPKPVSILKETKSLVEDTGSQNYIFPNIFSLFI